MSVDAVCEYLLVRVAPNPLRDEFVNVGVALFDAHGTLVGVRVTDDWRRVRALSPQFEPDDLRGLGEELTARLGGAERDGFLELAGETFSHSLRLSPRTAVWTADPAAELDRLYRELAAPPVALAGERTESPRRVIKRALERVFEQERVAHRLHPITAAELGAAGDHFRFDFAYRNGGQHCLQALPLGVEDTPVREFCFTLQRLRRYSSGLRATAFAGETEAMGPEARFQAELLAEAGVRLRSVAQAAAVAAEIRADLHLA